MKTSKKLREKISMAILTQYVSEYDKANDFDTNMDKMIEGHKDIVHWEPFEHWSGDDLVNIIMQSRDAVLSVIKRHETKK